MKVLLEILDDASQLLAALDSVEGMRPATRERLTALLEGLCEESTRLLRSDGAEQASSPVDGERFERRCREWLLQRSLEALAAGEYDSALSYLEEGAEAFPQDHEFLNHLGLVHWEMSDFDSAAASYEQAMMASFPVEVDGEVDWRDPAYSAYLRAMEGRALCLCRLERHDEALELFDALGKMNVIDFGGCRYMAGEIRHLRGDLDEAIEDYRLGPVEPASLYNLGLALFQVDDVEAAARTFIRAFVSNIHIVECLAGRDSGCDSCVPGYLGSRDYAKDFVVACQELWGEASEAVEFMESCFDHPMVRAYLSRCQRQGGESMLETDPARIGQESWLEALTDETSVDGLAERVVKRMGRE